METARDEEALKQIIALCQNVFEHKHYESAQQLLNAASHLARDMEDEASLLAIQKIAKEQYEWINIHESDSPMSARSAAVRNGIDFYMSTIRQVTTQILLVQRQRLRENSQASQA